MARADSKPATVTPVNPVTASADGLPTAQIDGVGWTQTVIGNTVYVGGAFTSARPAGSPAGTNETPRSNALSYDITTGVLTSWAPVVNGQVLTVTSSPDGSRVYIGGDFTSVNGQPRNRVAAFDTATGALVASWHPTVNSQVRAIATSGSTVYLGGSITAVGGVSRSRLAAVSAVDGTLLPWAPMPGAGPTDGNRNGNTATSDQVLALVVTSGGTQVVAAGRFDSMNGVKATGVAAIDATTGATRPYAVNQLLLNQGINSAIYSLYTNGTVVIGTGYDYYGPGNLEGSFTVDADTGNVIAINDCHGDSYGAFATGGVVYFSSHEHDCSNIGGFPEQSPRLNKFATAQTLAPTGTVGPFSLRSDAFYGKPASSELNWFPLMKAGVVTGQGQAGWSVTGTAQYVAYAGEFGSVNGVEQHGLVRYAMPSIAPNKVGPAFSNFTAAVDSPVPGSARIQWHATSDPDNENLTYRVYRNSTSTAPIWTGTQASMWWNRPGMSFTDTAAVATSQYRVTATDPFGNKAYTPWTTISATATPATRGYVDRVLADGATELWSLGEPAGAHVALGQRNLVVLLPGAGVTPGVTGAINGDADTAYRFDGTSAGSMTLAFDAGGGKYVPYQFQAPESTTAETWLRTTATSAGELMGFGTSATGDSAQTDRTLTMDASGRLTFSVLVAGDVKTVTSAASYNDGRWHHTAATLSPAGMFVYVDGSLVAARYDTPPRLTLSAFLRVGGDAGKYFRGDLDEVALYTTAPAPAILGRHYELGAGAAGNQAPSAAFALAQSGLGVTTDASASSDPDGAVTDYSWSFGDGTTGSGPTASHSYATPGTYAVTLLVTDDKGATGSSAQMVTVRPADVAPTAAFSSAVHKATVSVDASASSDPDGTVAGYAWNFGDGTAASGPTASHTYTAAGSYPVTLTVTDDQGVTGTTTATVIATPNQAPTAAFTSSVSNLTLSADATGSSDGDGTIASLAWDFGDGGTATGATPTHAYAVGGSYPVTLTVTDEEGAVASVTHAVTVAAPVVLASDAFGRTVASGLGAADVGGAWTVSGGSTRQSVAPGVATLRLDAPGNLTGSYLGAVSQTSADVSSTFSLSAPPTGGGASVYLTGRRVGANLEYRVRVRLLANGTVAVALTKLAGSSVEALIGKEVVPPGLTYVPGTALTARVLVSGTGSTALSATVWPAASPRPATPTVIGTDSTAALQAAGGVGVSAYLSGSATAPAAVRFTGLKAVPVQ